MIFDISEERIASNDTAAHIYLRQYGRHDPLYVSPKLSLMMMGVMMRVEVENPSLLNLDALPMFGHLGCILLRDGVLYGKSPFAELEGSSQIVDAILDDRCVIPFP